MIGNKHREDRFHLDVREGHVDDLDGQIWEVKVSKPGDGGSQEQQVQRRQRAPATDQLGKYQEKVLLLLQQHPKGLTMTAIGTEAKIPEKRRKKVIADLLASEQIEETNVSVGNQKTKRRGYKLRQHP